MVFFGAPLGLLALLGLPAVIVTHLFRSRLKEVPTSALWLWGPEINNSLSGRDRRPLQRRLSLWCELLAVVCIAGLLSQCQWQYTTTQEHVAVVLDGSSRLQARDRHGLTAHQRLITEFTRHLETAPMQRRWTLIHAGATPTILGAGLTSFETKRVLEKNWSASTPWPDLEAAWHLAATVGQNGSYWLSDYLPPLVPQNSGVFTVATQRNNHALVSAQRIFESGGKENSKQIILLRHKEFNPFPHQTTTSNQFGKIVRYVAAPVNSPDNQIPIPTNGRLHVPNEWQQQDIIVTPIKEDALPLDDRCILSPPISRQLRALISDLPPLVERDIWRALEATGSVIRAEALTDQEFIHLHIRGPDHHTNGMQAPGAWNVTLDDTAQGSPPFLGPFIRQSTVPFFSPLLQDVPTDGLIWLGTVNNLPTQQHLLTHLAGTSSRALISIQTSRTHSTAATITDRPTMPLWPPHITLHLDAERGNIRQHPAWPIFWANLVRWRQQWLPGIWPTVVSPGQDFQAIVPSANNRLELTHESGEKITLHANQSHFNNLQTGQIIAPPMPKSGAWTTNVTPQQTLYVLHGDEHRSDLRLTQRHLRAAEISVGIEHSTVPPWQQIILMLIAGACIAVSWLAWHKEEHGHFGQSSKKNSNTNNTANALRKGA